MAPEPKPRQKLNRRQRGALLALGVVAVAALAGLSQLSLVHFPGLPGLIQPLFFQSPTPKSVALELTATGAPAPQPEGTPTAEALPPWLAGHSTPTRPNEPGPTSTPTAYFVYLPGVDI